LVEESNSNFKSGSGDPRAVLLVGFMGAGKTTVGRELSARLKCRFVDLDDVVVDAAGKSVAQIFEEEGEAAFRQREKLALLSLLHSLPSDKATVIALGGGAYVQKDIYELIVRAVLPTVFLDARVDTLLERCSKEGRKRPLARDENQFRQLYETRRRVYMKAEHRVDTAGKPVDRIVNEIISRLGWSNEFPEVPPSR
jgi:shikimate kinase